MRSFQGKSKWRKIMESWPVLVLLFALLVVFAWNTVLFVGKMRLTLENRKIAEEKIKELNESKERLSRDIKNLETDKGVEERIREHYGLGLEGEGVVVILEDENAENNLNLEKDNGLWDKVKGWFE